MVLESVSGQIDTNLGQIQVGCVEIAVTNSGGTWQLTRGTTSSSSTFGSGTGTPFSWSIPPSTTTGAPSGILDLFGYQHDLGDIAVIRVGGTAPVLVLK